MPNPVLLLTHNTLELTKKCIASIVTQDIPVSLFVIDNDSSDGTEEWLSSDEYRGVWQRFSPQLGVSDGWNYGLDLLFGSHVLNAEYVLVPNSDTILAPWTYRRLLNYEVPFVTGATARSMDEISVEPADSELRDGPDFSLFLIRRPVFEKLGKFDSSMRLYASDCDYHLRAHRAGIRLLNSGLPFYHERSSTMKNANPKERRELELQADADRMAFLDKYGFPTWSPQYAAQFSPNNFGIES